MLVNIIYLFMSGWFESSDGDRMATLNGGTPSLSDDKTLKGSIQDALEVPTKQLRDKLRPWTPIL